QLLVLDVVSVVVVEFRPAVGLAPKDLVVRHERRRLARVGEVVVVEKAAVAAQFGEAMLKFVGKGVVEFAARPPKEPNAQLPGRLGILVKLLGLEPEVFEEMLREGD